MTNSTYPTPRYPVSRIAVLVAAFLIAGHGFQSRALATDRVSSPQPSSTAQREFQFKYAAVIDQLPPGEKVRCWVPLAQNTAHQFVTLDIKQPTEYRETVEPKYGNRMIYFEGQANAEGAIPIEINYRVTRLEVTPANRATVTAAERARFLGSSTLVPTDETLITELVRLAAGETPRSKLDDLSGRPLAQELYTMVGDRMRYDKPSGQPWGRGDAVWACKNGYGNCTDFHSLFIGSARARKLAAKFEIGFSIPKDTDRAVAAGYHCWAFFDDLGRWTPVDISEADKHPELRDYYFGNLSEDRVTFTVGRDLQLVPKQDAGPLNFMIGPYAERNGQPVDTIGWSK